MDDPTLNMITFTNVNICLASCEVFKKKIYYVFLKITKNFIWNTLYVRIIFLFCKVVERTWMHSIKYEIWQVFNNCRDIPGVVIALSKICQNCKQQHSVFFHPFKFYKFALIKKKHNPTFLSLFRSTTPHNDCSLLLLFILFYFFPSSKNTVYFISSVPIYIELNINEIKRMIRGRNRTCGVKFVRWENGNPATPGHNIHNCPSVSNYFPATVTSLFVTNDHFCCSRFCRDEKGCFEFCLIRSISSWLSKKKDK